MMLEILVRLDGTAQLALAFMGVLISILIWKWTAVRYTGFIANETRLFALTFLTAGFGETMKSEYWLFWVAFMKDVYRAEESGHLFMAYYTHLLFRYWLVYSVAFYWIRWMVKEITDGDKASGC